MKEDLITFNNVSKIYENKIILEDINISIKKGESVAIIGHNGEGKSTFLRMVSGLTKINSGEINYSHKLKFAYVPDNFCKLNITPRKYINHIGIIEGIPKTELEEKSEKLFRSFFLDKMIDISMKNLSKGSLQKVGVIQALLTNPDVLLLDEPLSGQDVKSQGVFISLVKKMKQDGVAIIMACHDELLVNKLSDTVYEINNRNLRLSTEFNWESDVLTFKNNKELTQNIKEIIEKEKNENGQLKIQVNKVSFCNLYEN